MKQRENVLKHPVHVCVMSQAQNILATMQYVTELMAQLSK